jgi:tetratricopeptide (TPR) repeat protein
MSDHFKKDALVGSKAEDDVLAASSQNLIIQAEQVMLQAAKQASLAKRDPAHMLRVLALMAAPVYNPTSPSRPPSPLELRQEWHVLAEGVRKSGAPILLARLSLPTLDSLRYALSPRAKQQSVFPHILHFSGHAWREGLLLEDELGQAHPATTAEILKALAGLPQPLDLVVLNGCESAADAESVAQALVDGGLARAVVGHERPVLDDEAVAFAANLYAELTGGFPLKDAVDRARKKITTHEVILLGDGALRFESLSGGEPIVDDRRQLGKLPSQSGHFYGRGWELVEISRALAHPPAVVVLSGPPGIGKSSLVLEAAHRNSWRFPGGVAYAAGPRSDDASTTTAAEMLSVLADALGLNRTEDLLLYGAEKPILLLLDNLESLPADEMDLLRDFLLRLGGESAAIVALRPSCEALEELPSARPMPLHRGLVVEQAARYALAQANQRGIDLTWERALFIARAVDGHPLLVEKLVSLAGRRDLDELLEEVAKKEGDFSARIETVYSWSAARLDEEGLAAWTALQLFPAGSAPEGVLRAAAGKAGPQKLREAALADFYPSEQLWRWHATAVEYARCHWPLSKDEQSSRMIELLPAWTEWLKRQPVGKELTLFRLEASRFNLKVLLDVSGSSSCKDSWIFLNELDERLPSPEFTLSLRELAARVCMAKLLLLPIEDKAMRAGLLNDLGRALSALGGKEEALAPVQEAVIICRQLAKSNPQTVLPCLAGSLNNLGEALSAIGHREEALAAAQESADIYCQLAESNPQAYLPNLAASFNNLGLRLSALGQWKPALAATQKAVSIRRQLAKSNPQIFLPYLARSLNNLGSTFSESGQREEALAPVQEALAICRQLAEANSQAFLPDLARSLGINGRVLVTLELNDEAALAFAEGLQHLVTFYRNLPRAYAGLVNTLRRSYLEACQKAGLEPDKNLLSQFG